MSNGKWTGPWAGSRQSGPFSSKPYTKRDVRRIAESYRVVLSVYGVGHRTTEAHRESLERSIASYNATHRKPWRGRHDSQRCFLSAVQGLEADNHGSDHQ